MYLASVIFDLVSFDLPFFAVPRATFSECFVFPSTSLSRFSRCGHLSAPPLRHFADHCEVILWPLVRSTFPATVHERQLKVGRKEKQTLTVDNNINFLR